MRHQNGIDAMLKPRYMTTLILWFALTMSMVIYLVVGYLLAKNGTPAPEAERVLTMPLYVVGAATTMAGAFLRGFLFSDDRIEKALSKPFAAVSPGANALSPRDHQLLGLAARFYTPFILNMAINESVVLYGLILTLMYRDINLMLPFFAAGVLLNLTLVKIIPSVVERGGRLLR